jgi:drug/metabolite transporter (DMT)-like permease
VGATASMVIGWVFALAATLLNSVAGLLESDATRHVPRGRWLVTRPRYLAGLVVDGLGWAATVVALRYLPVFVVQAVLGGAIALTAVGARLVYGSALRRVDRLACAACLAGLLLVAASAGVDRPAGPSSSAELVLGAAAIVLLVALVVAWRAHAAWPLALVAGLGFGGSSVAVRAVHLTAGERLVGLLAAPSLYLVIVFGAVGLVAYSRALERANLARVTAILLVTEATVPGLAGIVLLGDSVRPGWWPAMGVGLVLAVAGVVVLAGSPAQRPPPLRR